MLIRFNKFIKNSRIIKIKYCIYYRRNRYIKFKYYEFYFKLKAKWLKKREKRNENKSENDHNNDKINKKWKTDDNEKINYVKLIYSFFKAVSFDFSFIIITTFRLILFFAI